MEKFFIGYDKEGIEHLLVKKYDELTSPVIPYYKDIKSHKTFQDFELIKLYNFSDIIKYDGVKSKRKVKKAYKLDREELISIYDLVIADIYKTTIIGNNLCRNKIETNVLCRFANNMKVHFETIENGKQYPGYYLGLIDENFITNIKKAYPYFEEVTNETEMQKGKILKLYNDIRKDIR